MGLQDVKSSLPDYAKDLRLNLGSIELTTELSLQQLWGAFLAAAAATKSERLVREVSTDAFDKLSAQASHAALSAASIMGMNNVFYRARDFLGGRYDDLRPGLRMNVIANPGVPKPDFELWSFAVSAINGCGHCLAAHEAALREAGVARTAIFEVLRLAAVMAGVAQALELIDGEMPEPKPPAGTGNAVVSAVDARDANAPRG